MINKSNKLKGVCYDIRGPVLDAAGRLEDQGNKILKLNIGNPAAFGFSAPDDIVKVSDSIGEDTGTPIMAFGSNCGVGAAELVAAIININTALGEKAEDTIIISKANCGVPEYVNGEIVYSGTEEIMADYAGMAIDAGANIVGGCCGTSPQHVAAMRKAIDNHTKGTSPTRADIESRLGELSTGAIAQMEGKLEIADGAFTKKDEPRRSRRRK